MPKLPYEEWKLSSKLLTLNDQRLQIFQELVEAFHTQLKLSDDKNKNFREIRVVGSSGWLWLLKSLLKDNPWLEYFAGNEDRWGTVDIDLRNIIKKSKNPKNSEYDNNKGALFNLADVLLKTEQRTHSSPLDTQGYAQVTLNGNTFMPSVDWTVTYSQYAPLHNYDTYAILEKKGSTRLYLFVADFDGAEEARNRNEFLLNPLIFHMEEGIPKVNTTVMSDTASTNIALLTNKCLAWMVKTICKISMTGITLADSTLTYLQALANTPLSLGENILTVPYNITNPSILQSVLCSFFKLHHIPATHDDRYIFERGLKSIKVQVKEQQKSLYDIFVTTSSLAYFADLVSVAPDVISEELRRICGLTAPLPASTLVTSRLDPTSVKLQPTLPKRATLTDPGLQYQVPHQS